MDAGGTAFYGKQKGAKHMQFLSYLVNGISLGSIYAVIALGYTMVYGIARMLNFAHGDVIMVGGYVAFVMMTSLGLPRAGGNLRGGGGLHAAGRCHRTRGL